jgi:hypothetical protein
MKELHLIFLVTLLNKVYLLFKLCFFKIVVQISLIIVNFWHYNPQPLIQFYEF